MSAIGKEKQRGPRRSKRKRGDPAETRTPAQIAAQARLDRDADHNNRSLSNTFKFWRLCANTRCRRMHACAGLPDCFSHKWRQVHPDDRFLVREASLAHARGADPQHATRIAQAKLAERNALQAKFDAVKERQRRRNRPATCRPHRSRGSARFETASRSLPRKRESIFRAGGYGSPPSRGRRGNRSRVINSPSRNSAPQHSTSAPIPHWKCA
jgi:hypothetical protein